MKIVPFLGMFAGALSEPPPYPADRPGVPDRLAPSRPIPTPKPVPTPVAPLASVPDATLRRRARKGDREAVAELARRAAVWPEGQPPDALDRVRRVRAMGSVNPETGAHHRGLAETLAALRENGWDVEAADRAMRGAP